MLECRFHQAEISAKHTTRQFPTGKFYEFNWIRGATEMQDEQPYEYEEEIEITEMVQKQVMTTKWVKA